MLLLNQTAVQKFLQVEKQVSSFKAGSLEKNSETFSFEGNYSQDFQALVV
jgi:hypothetical protein